QGVVIDHVVAVGRARHRRERRREVQIGHAQIVQIGHDRGGLAEAELGSELESVGGDRSAHTGALSTRDGPANGGRPSSWPLSSSAWPWLWLSVWPWPSLWLSVWPWPSPRPSSSAWLWPSPRPS